MINLLSDKYKDRIQRTSLTRKITLDGFTEVYPVYRIPIDLIYYNDQNDRIATWISQYKVENSVDGFNMDDRESYNKIVEQFVVDSNPAAIEKTRNNIGLVGQREPGVVLSDGRVIDGNRRFTCLRQLAESNPDKGFFEAVILEADIDSGRKQIKMLELAIQHGEEKKVDYNPLDRIIGAYQDIVETELLSINEYAESTNETVSEVKKRLAIGQMVVDFLEFVHMPKQYHNARDLQVVSVFTDLQPLLRKCNSHEEEVKLKETVFSNIMMGTIGDSRKYVRNLNSMMESGFFNVYMKEQERIRGSLEENLEDKQFKTKEELNTFVHSNDEIAEELQLSMDKSLLKAKKRQTRNKPAQTITKSITLLKDVDTRIFDKLDIDEKAKLKTQLDKLAGVVDRFEIMVNEDGTPTSEPAEIQEEIQEEVAKLKPACVHPEEPIVICERPFKKITNLGFALNISALSGLSGQEKEADYELFFVDSKDEIVSNINEVHVVANTKTKCSFSLESRMSQENIAYLVMRSSKDDKNEIQKKIAFDVEILFESDFGF